MSACNFDFPDCVNGTTGRGSVGRGSSSKQENRFFCAQGCPNTWLGDKVCDNKCRTASCGWDMGDCGVSLVAEDFPGVTFFDPVDVINVNGSNAHNSLSLAMESTGLRKDSQAVEIIKLSSRNSTDNSSKIIETVSVGPPLWREVNVSHPPDSTLSAVEKKGETLGEEDSFTYPVALTIEYGAMGVYFNMSYIPCEALSLQRSNAKVSNMNKLGESFPPYRMSSIFAPECTPERIVDPFSGPSTGYSRVVVRGEPVAWSDFSYSSVSYDIVEPFAHDTDVNASHTDSDGTIVKPSELLTSLALIQKQHMLIMLLYGHPDFFEDPSTNTESPTYIPPSARDLAGPVDIRITIRGYDYYTHVNLTARFVLRVMPKKPTGSDIDISSNVTISEDEQMIPVNMAPVLANNASLASCMDIRDLILREKELLGDENEIDNSPVEGVSARSDVIQVDGLLRVDNVQVLPQPFLLPKWDSRFQQKMKREVLTLVKPSLPESVNKTNSSLNNYNETQQVSDTSFSTLGNASQGFALSISLKPQSLSPFGRTAQLPLREFKVQATVTLSSGERYFSTQTLCELAASLSDTGRVIPTFPSVRHDDGSHDKLLEDCMNPSVTDESITLQSLMIPNARKGSRAHNEELQLLLMFPMPIEWKTASMLHYPSTHLQMFAKLEIFEEFNNTNGLLEFPRVGCVGGPMLWGASDLAYDDEVHAEDIVSQNITSDIAINGSISLELNSSITNHTNTTTADEDVEKEVDTYAMSLIHVNKLYHSAFGAENRKVPAHMPHLIDSGIMEEMQQMWKKEWEDTSSHRFRSVKDMQYAFSYYYYVAHRNKAHHPDLLHYISEHIDTDSDGYLSDNEFLTLATLIYQHNPTDNDMEELRNCSVGNVSNTLSTEVNANNSKTTNLIKGRSNVRHGKNIQQIHTSGPKASHKSVAVSRTPYGVFTETVHVEAIRFPSLEELLECTLVVEGLKKHVPWPAQHSFETDKDVSFEMIGDNVTEVRTQLNGIRASRNKFVCVNDQMKEPSDELKAMLLDFYLSYFPFPSQFERSSDDPNPVLYFDQYQKLMRARSEDGSVDHFRQAHRVNSASWGGLLRMAFSWLYSTYSQRIQPHITHAWGVVYACGSAGQREARLQLLKYCRWGNSILTEYAQWLEVEHERISDNSHIPDGGNEVGGLSQLHHWAQGSKDSGDMSNCVGSGCRLQGQEINGVDNTGLKVELWVPYSVMCFSFLGLGFLLFLQRSLRQTNRRHSRNSGSISSSRGGNSTEGVDTSRNEQQYYESSMDREQLSRFVTEDGGVDVAAERDQKVHDKSAVSRFLSSIGLTSVKEEDVVGKYAIRLVAGVFFSAQ